MLDLSVVVPVRNAESMVDECLASIAHSGPREIIVVDGQSSDRTRDLARHYPVQVVSDRGRGVAAARGIGIRAARSDTVALIDVDIVFPEGGLASLYEEFIQGGYAALQAGLHSESGPGYWGRALASHHNFGRSRKWPGVMATVFQRQVLIEHGFDERFLSGEDIELRWRLRAAGLKLGVSSRTVVTHRFGDTYASAREQFLADGKGLGRMVSKYGWRAAGLLAIPAAGCARGIALSLVHRQPALVPYYLVYLVYNYRAMASALRAGLQ